MNVFAYTLVNMCVHAELQTEGGGLMLASRNRKLLASTSSSILCKYIIKVSWIQECTLTVQQYGHTNTYTYMHIEVHTLTHHTRTYHHFIYMCAILKYIVNHSYHIVYEMSSKMNLMCAQFRNSFPILLYVLYDVLYMCVCVRAQVCVYIE